MFYKFALTNARTYLASLTESDRLQGAINAFEISAVLAIIFCKAKEEILEDLVRIEL